MSDGPQYLGKGLAMEVTTVPGRDKGSLDFVGQPV